MAEEGQVRTEERDAQAEATRRLALAQIRQYPDPVLRLKAQEVESFDADLAMAAIGMDLPFHVVDVGDGSEVEILAPDER